MSSFDDEKFNALLEKASQGDAEAQTEVWRVYDNGLYDAIPNCERTGKLPMARKMTESQKWLAQYNKNTQKKARRELIEYIANALVAKFEASGYYFMDVCYKNDDDKPKNDEESNAYFEKATATWRIMAEQGNASAQFNLGICYYNGEGVPKDFAQAAAWFRKAAEQGDADAQYSLGVCYGNGEGMPKDLETAKTWWKMAAENGSQPAKNNLKRLSE